MYFLPFKETFFSFNFLLVKKFIIANYIEKFDAKVKFLLFNFHIIEIFTRIKIFI